MFICVQSSYVYKRQNDEMNISDEQEEEEEARKKRRQKMEIARKR